MEQTRALQSQALLWWPWSTGAYQRMMMGLSQVAATEGVSVEMSPFFNAPNRSSLPVFRGLRITVWSVTQSVDNPPQDDVLSGFQTRLCDDTDQDDEEEVCCVCLDNLYRGSVTTLNCRHEFHSDCIRRWLVHGQNFCPLCKAPAMTR